MAGLREKLTARLQGDGPLWRVARNSGWLLSGKGVAAVLSLFYLAIVTRTLGPASFGVFALILTIAQFIRRFTQFDSWQGVVKFGHDLSHHEDDRLLGRLVGTTLTIDLVTAVLGLILLVPICFGAGTLLGWDADVQRWSAIYTGVILFALYSTPTGVLRLLDRFGASAVAETTIPVTRMVGALAALLLSPTIEGFILAWMASELAATVAYWLLARHYGPQIVREVRLVNPLTIPRRFPGLIRFLLAANVNLTITTLMSQAPILLLGSFTGAAAAGFYRLAAQLSNAMTRISQMLARAIFTEMARSNVNADRDLSRREVARILTRTSMAAGIAATIIALALIVLGKPLILLMSGEAYLPAYPLLLMLGVAAAIEVGSVSIDPLLLATDRARQLVIIRVVTLAAMMAGMIYAIDAGQGAFGTAAAVLGATALALVLRIGAVLRGAKG